VLAGRVARRRDEIAASDGLAEENSGSVGGREEMPRGNHVGERTVERDLVVASGNGAKTRDQGVPTEAKAVIRRHLHKQGGKASAMSRRMRARSGRAMLDEFGDGSASARKEITIRDGGQVVWASEMAVAMRSRLPENGKTRQCPKTRR